MKKKILIILGSMLVVGIIGGIIGYYYYTKPIKNFVSSDAEIKINANALFQEFINNETQANSKFVSDDKTIQVEGLVRDIQHSSDGAVTINFYVSDSGGTVSCSLVKDEYSKASKYKDGMNIKIKGQCTGYQELIDKEVIMIRCGIVE